MRKDTSYLKLLHGLSIAHRDAVLGSEICGCFFCIREFPSADITDWTDNGRTALCPNCDIDSVLPGSIVHIDTKMLAQMNERWFCEPVDSETAAAIDAAVQTRPAPKETKL